MPPLIRRKAGRKPATTDDWKTMTRRGTEQLRLAEESLKKGHWQAAALASLHAFRSNAEALVAFRVGIRTATEGTGELAYLLLRHFQRVEDQVERFIRMSDLHQEGHFESRSFNETEARRSLASAREFSLWASKQLPSTS